MIAREPVAPNPLLLPYATMPSATEPPTPDEPTRIPPLGGDHSHSAGGTDSLASRAARVRAVVENCNVDALDIDKSIENAPDLQLLIEGNRDRNNPETRRMGGVRCGHVSWTIPAASIPYCLEQCAQVELPSSPATRGRAQWQTQPR